MCRNYLKEAPAEAATARSVRPAALLGAVVFLCALLTAPPTWAGPCSNVASSAFRACKNEVNDDYWIANGNCTNVPDLDERLECRGEAKDERDDARDECDEQLAARLELCDALGEGRYDPDFAPEDFETEFDNQNPYWPLKAGNRWVFEGGEETITVEVLDEIKLIEGVTCIVVNDVVEEDGEPIEDTDDWYAQAENGDVWYMGEISMSFETFDGDDPEVAELVDVEGSWKAGRDSAQPGIVMFAAPVAGTVYRQEVSLGDAEDAAEVLSTSYSYGDDPELDEMVPEELADLLCDDDCVVTREFSPIEPDVEGLKYYSPLVGLFLEVEDGDIVELVECNVDPVCDELG